MKIVVRTLIVVVVLVGAVLAFATTRPDTLHVERATSINAAPETIAPLITDFHSWSSWSPYEKRDPAMKRTFSGAPSGKGAVYQWEGNSDVGSGRMEITDVSPSKVTIKLDFIEPFEGHNIAEFMLEPKGESTNVTWAMHGPNLYVGKVLGIFMDMDNMIGTDFATGLANLKAMAE